MTLLQEPFQQEQLGEVHPDTIGSSNQELLAPYFQDVDSMHRELSELMQSEPYFSGVREDGRTFSIFMNESTSPLSSLAKALDAGVREKDDRWRDPREVTVKSMEHIQSNSFYFTYVDTTDPSTPKVGGSLMVADMSGLNADKSDTLAYFKKQNPGAEIPAEMVPGIGKTLWDIVSVMVKDDPEFRDGIASAYLYHALYKRACEVAGITAENPEGDIDLDWIACNSADEMVNTRRRIGIPFAEVESDTPTTFVEENGVSYTVCHLSVKDIYPNVAPKIRKYESAKGIGATLMAKAARIALVGNPDSSQVELWNNLNTPTIAA